MSVYRFIPISIIVMLAFLIRPQTSSAQFSPLDLSGLQIWLAGDSGITLTNDSVSQWNDLSGNERHAISWAPSIQPSVLPNALNGHQAIAFDGSFDFMQFPDITDCRTIFWIIRENPNASNIVSRPMLGWTGYFNFLRGPGLQFWDPTYSHPGVHDGATRLNGNNIIGTETIVPPGFSMVCLKTTENVEASHFSMEQNIYGRTWWGDLAELIIYNTPLSDEDILQVENYLANKYGPAFTSIPDIEIETGYCDTTICAPDGFLSYTWSDGSNEQCATFNQEGEYYLEATDLFGRTVHDTILVNYPGNLQLPDSVSLCYGETFEWDLALDDSQFDISWDNIIHTSVISLTQAGDHILTISNELNCQFEHSFHLEIDSLSYDITLGPDISTCAGNMIFLQPHTYQDLQYLWNTDETTSGIVVTETGDYDVAVTDINNCVAFDTIHIEVLGVAPDVSFTIATACEGAATAFNGNSNGNITSWNWNFGDDSTGNGASVLHTYDTPGDYEISLLITATSGCENTAIQTLHIFAKPVVSYVAGLACTNQPITFTDTSTSPEGVPTQWNWFIDGVFYSGQVINATINDVGFQNVILEVTDNNGCSTELSSFTEVKAAPDMDFSFTGICEGSLTSFTEQVDDSQSGNINSYIWNFGDNTGSALSNPSHFFTQDNSYLVTLQATSIHGCVGDTSKQVTIYASPIADFAISNACSGLPYTFQETVITQPGNEIVSWHWIVDGEFTFEGQEPQFTFTETGLNQVSLQVMTSNGCTDIISQQIPVWSRPIADFSFEPEIGQAPFDVQFINETNDAVSAYWYFGDTHESDELNPQYIFTMDGTYYVQMIATNNAGCSDTIGKILTVAEPRYDIALNVVDYLETPNGYQLTARIANTGNIRVNQIMLAWQIGNDAPVLEEWTGELLPNETFDYQFHSLLQVAGQQYPYVCVEVEPSPLEYTEINKTDNSICKPLSNTGLELFPPFPNPGDDRMFIRFITPIPGDLQIDVYDVKGSRVMQIPDSNVPKGFHQYFIDISSLPQGNYQLVLEMDQAKASTAFMKIKSGQ